MDATVATTPRLVPGVTSLPVGGAEAALVEVETRLRGVTRIWTALSSLSLAGGTDVALFRPPELWTDEVRERL